MHKYWPKEIGSNVDKMWGKEQKMSQDIKGTSRGQGVTPGTHVKGGDKKKKKGIRSPAKTSTRDTPRGLKLDVSVDMCLQRVRLFVFSALSLWLHTVGSSLCPSVVNV